MEKITKEELETLNTTFIQIKNDINKVGFEDLTPDILNQLLNKTIDIVEFTIKQNQWIFDNCKNID